MRIVIDSNVWISALVFGGKPRKVFELIVQDGLRLVVSEEILTEVRRNLKRKFPEFLPDFEDLLVVLERNTQRIKLGSVTINASRDADDNRILETAVIGGADYIVTGDKDLLSLSEHDDISILTPAQFLDA